MNGKDKLNRKTGKYKEVCACMYQKGGEINKETEVFPGSLCLVPRRSAPARPNVLTFRRKRIVLRFRI